jgi:hypothetical protein
MDRALTNGSKAATSNRADAAMHIDFPECTNTISHQAITRRRRIMNLGLFENLIRSAIEAENPSRKVCRYTIVLLDAIALTTMENFEYGSRLAMAIFATKTLLKKRIEDLEEIGYD